MNPGETFSFDDLAGAAGRSLPRIRALNFAYLQGRLLLDARVDDLHMPPIIRGIAPSVIEVDGPLMALIEVSGSHFHPSARLTFRGPPDIAISQAGVLEGQQGAPDQIVASILAATLFPGVYDVEIENPDGQRSVLPNALEIR